ncbi:MAG TPA: hypothetical protein VMQ11_10205 [Alphaproteobacteria bacterium]|nr:hypothetical protein [Alphaproteobacteria bacterium]
MRLGDTRERAVAVDKALGGGWSEADVKRLEPSQAAPPGAR